MKIKFYIVLIFSFLFFKFNYGFPIDKAMNQSSMKKKNLVYTVLFTKLNIQVTNLFLFLDFFFVMVVLWVNVPSGHFMTNILDKYNK